MPVAAVFVLATIGIGACGGSTSGSDGPGRADTSTIPEQRSVPAGREVRVERIVDGDTIVVGGGERVRLIGIDTPESVKPGTPVECFAKEASRYLESLISPGTPVVLVADVEPTDQYDRTLAYVYRARDGLFVNEALVEDGYANVATFPPNVEHVDVFLAAERAARNANRGLWSAC
jgi:micrococcal nuclease